MPELPEVEHARRVIERLAAGRRVDDVRCATDLIVFEGRSSEEVQAALHRKTISGVHRRGKYLWLTLDSGPHPIFHLGMTGTFRVRGDEPLVLSSSPKVADRSWPPRFTKIHFFFDDGGELVMTNARRLGRVLLRADPPREPPLSRLGFDPLTDMPTLARFRALLSPRRRAVLKGLLLDQSFAAGVGNWIADEVLFQAGIDPRRRVGSLEPPEVQRLHRALRHVIGFAVEVDARKEAFPKTWLFHHRWGKSRDAKTSLGEPIEHLTVAGRTTAWVPSRQR